MLWEHRESDLKKIYLPTTKMNIGFSFKILLWKFCELEKHDSRLDQWCTRNIACLIHFLQKGEKTQEDSVYLQ